MAFEKLIEAHQKVPVEHYPHQVTEKPALSVLVMVYQHAQYLRQCLDGILMQETDFDFEIIVGDDQSSDGSREICIEYAEKFPDKIRLFLHRRENNIRVNGNPTGRFNHLYAISQTNGRYIAMCEGDDYWTDPKKLQKQYDFLEKNQEYLCVVHHTKILYENEEEAKGNRAKFTPKKVVTKRHLYLGWQFHVNSLVYRNIKDIMQHWDHRIFIDLGFFLMLGYTGKIAGLQETMSVYRKHSEGLSGFYNKNLESLMKAEMIWLDAVRDELKPRFFWGYTYMKGIVYEKHILEKNPIFSKKRWTKLKNYLTVTILSIFMYPRQMKVRIRMIKQYLRS